MRNLAPLPQPHNVTARNSVCSAKLQPGGIYERAANDANFQDHPYLNWLSANQGGVGARLDDQAFLEKNANPGIGDDRIAHLTATLETKL